MKFVLFNPLTFSMKFGYNASKKIFPTFFLIVTTNACMAQTEVKSNPQLGFHYMASNYLNNDYKSGYVSGYKISLINGLKGNYDYLIVAGISSPYFSIARNKNKSATGLAHYIDFGIVKRMYRNGVRINPFIHAGLGMQYYSSQFSPLVVGGGGLKFRLAKGIYFVPQANFKLQTATNNSFNLIFGLLGTLKHRKQLPAVTVVNISQQENKDLDQDGIPNELDSCPTIKGSIAFHGCPDSDGDGIPDLSDSCKTVPGFIEYKGCPVPKEGQTKIATITQKYLMDSLTQQLNEIGRQIKFESNLYSISPLSFDKVAEIAKILKNHPGFSLNIYGHTDSTGNTEQNRILSQQRSTAVKDLLIQLGISPLRLKTFGWGSNMPIADNNTPEGRQQNRRTEFQLVERKDD